MSEFSPYRTRVSLRPGIAIPMDVSAPTRDDASFAGKQWNSPQTSLTAMRDKRTTQPPAPGPDLSGLALTELLVPESTYQLYLDYRLKRRVVSPSEQESILHGLSDPLSDFSKARYLFETTLREDL